MSENLPEGLIRSKDGRVRCNWQDEKDDYRIYHDEEWGRPQDDDVKLFEKDQYLLKGGHKVMNYHE